VGGGSFTMCFNDIHLSHAILIAFIAFIACDIAFIAFIACDIAFIAFIACDVAFVANLKKP
jgi:hypothetical protein